jgi:hypothetical protein
LPVPASPPAARPNGGCIAAEIDATAAWQHDKSGKHPKLLIIFAICRNGSAFDHKGGSDRKALRQTAQLVAYR